MPRHPSKTNSSKKKDVRKSKVLPDKVPTSSSSSNCEPDFFSQPKITPSHRNDSSSSESNDDNSIGRPGPSNQHRNDSSSSESNDDNSTGRPGPSNIGRPGPSNQPRIRFAGNNSIVTPGSSRTGIKAGTNAGPLSRKTPQSQSAPSRSVAPTPQSPARKTPRKQAKPKKRRDHVLQQIRMLQNTVHYLIPRAPFHRLVREIMQKEVTFGTHEDFRISSDALQALQSSVEAYMVNLLEDASFCCRHRDRVTLMCKDIILLRVLRHDPALVRHL